jgi:rifampicin phosphotransferase
MPLYEVDGAEASYNIKFENVSSVVAAVRKKRRIPYRIASSLGAVTPPGWVVNMNGAGVRRLAEPETFNEIFAGASSDKLVLDLDEGLRQIIVSRAEMSSQLQAMLYDGSDDTVIHALVIRDFISGDQGLISTICDGLLVLETSPDGLMAMNRGHARARQWTFDTSALQGTDGHPAAALSDAVPLLSANDLMTIARVTAALDDRYGVVAAEWVHAGGMLYFADYSIVGQELRHVDTPGDTVISSGEAGGPTFTLKIPDTELIRLSDGAAVNVRQTTDFGELEWACDLINEVASLPENPIIVAARPYAALSVLIGHVAGFIFTEGSILCHLAILLRESGTPAVISAQTPQSGYAHIADGTVRYIPSSRSSFGTQT